MRCSCCNKKVTKRTRSIFTWNNSGKVKYYLCQKCGDVLHDRLFTIMIKTELSKDVETKCHICGKTIEDRKKAYWTTAQNSDGQTRRFVCICKNCQKTMPIPEDY